MKLLIFIMLVVVSCLAEDQVSSLKVLKKGEKTTFSVNRKADTILAKEQVAVPPDQGGNYGDLIYRGRETGDRLLIREVVLIPAIDSYEQEYQWYTTVANARTISTVRSLNIGRERAYTVRIDVAGQDAQVIFRVPGYSDPRLLIEVYGY